MICLNYANYELKSVNNVEIGFVLPVPPEKVGLVNQLNLVMSLSKDKNIKPMILTPTPDPDPIYNIKVISIGRSIFFPIKLIRAIRKRSLAIIHLQFYYGLYGVGESKPVYYISSILSVITVNILAKMLGIKTIITLHSVFKDITKESVLENYKSRRYLNILIKFVNFLITISSSRILVFSQKQLKILSPKSRNNKIKVIPLGFRKLSVKRRVHEKFAFLYFGFIRRNKGLFDLLEAFERISIKYDMVQLVILAHKDEDSLQVNDGYAEKTLSKIKKLKERCDIVDHIGWSSWEQIQETLEICDVLVLPYTDYSNEVSGVVSDLADSGIPIICSNTPRFQSTLEEDKDALFFEPGDIVQLCYKMEQIMNDRDLYCRLSHNIKQKAENNSWEKIAKEHLNVYYSIIKSER